MSELTLDHVVIAVRDLDAATADYTKLLGREPSWRGDHPAYGTRNTLYRIENTYIELLGHGAKTSGRWAGELSRRLEHGEGLYMLALGTPDINATAREMRDAGLEVQDPRDGDGIDQITGTRRAWRNALVPPRASHGVRLFFIEHKSPQEALPVAPPAAAEGTYVKRMDHAVVLSADMEMSRQLWANTLGVRLALDRSFPERNTRILFFRLGDITIEISGGAQQTEEGMGKPDRLWGIAWGVDDLAKTCERLQAAGVDVSGPRKGIKPGTLVATVKGEHTHGVATLLIEHTAESFREESRTPQGAAYDNAPQRRAFRAVGLDHVALSAADAGATARKFADILGLQGDAPLDAESQPLRLVRIGAGNAFLELTQPLSEDHRIAKAIAERGPGMYAIGITVDNIDEAVRDLRSKGVFVSDAEYGIWPGTRTARVNPAAANGVNIVLVEHRPDVI
jgi:catechol 2,3-dioxygenase-like lactoylglutathione lyase family enzyme